MKTSKNFILAYPYPLKGHMARRDIEKAFLKGKPLVIIDPEGEYRQLLDLIVQSNSQKSIELIYKKRREKRL